MSSHQSSPVGTPRSPTRASRRRFPKTKTGCKTCKRRKIKCDEEKPSCRNCVRHNVTCDFLAVSQPASVSPSPSSWNPDDLNMLDLELLLNYTTSTFSTFSNDRLMQDFWRHTVPDMGLQCDFVMRCILALSALHIASYRPERREFYISTALRHHQLASRKAMFLLGHVTEETAENLFIFSLLTICVALGSPRKADGTLLVGESSCPEWMALLKGTKSIVAVMGERRRTGRLAFLFEQGQQRLDACHGPGPGETRLRDKLEAFDHLKHLLRTTVQDERELETYTTAVTMLQNTWDVLDKAQNAKFSDAFIWVWHVADDFLPLLQAPTQEAVVILAYFCVHLKRLENLWWFKGWADHLISKAWELLDETHRLWIRWPIEEVGWVAPLG